MLIVPEHHVAVRQHQAGAERVVGVPDLHVGGIGGVADAERVEEQEAADAAGDDAGDQAVEPAAAQRREVGRREARGLPLGEGQRGRTDLDAVVVVGRAVGATRPGRVDAAVHGVSRARAG